MKTIQFFSTAVAMVALAVSLSSCEDLFGDDEEVEEASVGVKYEAYTFSCPGSAFYGPASHTVNVPYISSSCLVTKKRFTRVSVCNLIDDFKKVQSDCKRDCGRGDCAEPGLGI